MMKEKVLEANNAMKSVFDDASRLQPIIVSDVQREIAAAFK